MRARGLNITLIMMLCVTAFDRNLAGHPGSRDVSIGDHRYVISVPGRSIQKPANGEEPIRLHLEERPVTNVVGHFSVHVQDRNNAGLDRWVEYHLNRNLPSLYGKYKLDSTEERTLGSYPVRLIHTFDLENEDDYALLELIGITDQLVVIMSYLYDEKLVRQAYEEMESIVASFQHSAAACEHADRLYQTGRTLGLEREGLFLRLPHGWIPQDKRSRRDQVTVTLPYGDTLNVLTFEVESVGSNRLSKLLGRHTPRDFSAGEIDGRDPFGILFRAALSFERKVSDGSPSRIIKGIVRLRGRGGCALVLNSTDPADCEMLLQFRKKYGNVASQEVRDLLDRTLAEF